MTRDSIALEMDGVHKSYGENVALSGLSLAVGPGEAYGLIGPNGAGKTTTLMILAGLIESDAGRASVLGGPATRRHDASLGRLGFSSSCVPLFDYLTGWETLVAGAALRGLGRIDAERRTDDLLQLFDLSDAARHYVYEYSSGMRQKLSLAFAFVHAPDLLLLDEPFDALDAVALFRLCALIRRVVERGGTVLLTSHDLAIVERVCDRVGVLNDGRLQSEMRVRRIAPGEEQTSQQVESFMWSVVGAPTVAVPAWL